MAPEATSERDESVAEMLNRCIKQVDPVQDTIYAAVDKIERIVTGEETPGDASRRLVSVLKELAYVSHDELTRLTECLPRFEDGEIVPWGSDEIVWKDSGEARYVYNGLADYGIPVAIAGDTIVAVADTTNGGLVRRRRSEPTGSDGIPVRHGETLYLDREHYGRAGGYGDVANDEPMYGLIGIAPLDKLIVREIYVADGVAFARIEKECAFCPVEWLTHAEPDSRESIEADMRKCLTGYWKCAGADCDECPSKIDGKTPSEHYGAFDCSVAAGMDIARRLAELDKRTGGE